MSPDTQKNLQNILGVIVTSTQIAEMIATVLGVASKVVVSAAAEQLTLMQPGPDEASAYEAAKASAEGPKTDPAPAPVEPTEL